MVKIIRNYNDANIMIDRGHKLIKIDRDVRNRKYLIFVFEYSEKLIEDLNFITKKIN